MYQILIAEDDDAMRGIFAEIIPWDKSEYNVCGSFANGLVAKKYLESYPVDVAVLDINMPLMTGLELSKFIKENFPRVLVVLISAYNEFEYVREALRNEVFDYITKPLNKKALDETFFKLRSKLAERKITHFMPYDLVLSRQRLFCDLYSDNEGESLPLLKNFGINIDRENYPCAVLRIGFKTENNRLDDVWAQGVEQFFNILSNILFETKNTYLLLLKYDAVHFELAAVSKNPCTMGGYDTCLLDDCDYIRNTLISNLNTDCSVFIQKRAENINAFHKLHIENETVSLHHSNNKDDIMLLTVEKSKEYVRKNYARDITLSDIALSQNLSYCYFSTIFKQYTGETFIDYLNRVRIDEAKKLIAYTDEKLSVIAETVGFNDSKYFSRQFKSNVGVTPLEYRNETRKG